MEKEVETHDGEVITFEDFKLSCPPDYEDSEIEQAWREFCVYVRLPII